MWFECEFGWFMHFHIFVHYWYLHIPNVSNTLRLVSWAKSCLEKLVRNNCHVACAYRMCANDVYVTRTCVWYNCHVVCAYRMRANDVYLVHTCVWWFIDEFTTLCAWTNDDVFTLHSHINAHIQRGLLNVLITSSNRTRCNTARQLSVHNRSYDYIRRCNTL